MRVAIVGVTGAVGRQMLLDLAASRVGDIDLLLFASERSAGVKLEFRGREHVVRAFELAKLRGVDFVLMSAGGAFSRAQAAAIAEQGSLVIDNSSAWRMHPDVPLVVPEVNGHLLMGRKGGGIIANPNCSTIQLVVTLQPLHRHFGVQQVIVSTYQSVSGTGQKGIAELAAQAPLSLAALRDVKPKTYAKPIAFNVIPAIDVLDANGHCFEEEKMVRETRKIMGIDALDVQATTARIPAYHCHSESVSVRLRREVSRDEALDAFAVEPGIVLDRSSTYENLPTPLAVHGDGRVWVSRVRLPLGNSKSEWVQYWNVADNLKKGAATNAVQIMEAVAYG